MRHLVLCAISFAVCLPAVAQPVGHYNVAPPEHVMLEYVLEDEEDDELICPAGGGSSWMLRIFRILPDGGREEFEIPSGHHLVLTDFDMKAGFYSGHPAGGTFEPRWSIRTRESNVVRTVLVSSTLLPATLNPGSYYSATSRSAAGLVVGSGAAACPEFRTDGTGIWSQEPVESARAQGYLLPVDVPE